VIFGGGRLSTKTSEVPLDYDTFLEVYEDANKAAVSPTKKTAETKEVPRVKNNTSEPETSSDVAESTSDDDDVSTTSEETPEVSEEPRTRVRRRRTEN
jgi:hypothetical protein